MFDNGASVAMGGLVAIDLTVADHAELSDAARFVARLQSFVDHAKVQIARRTRQLADAGDRTFEHLSIDEGPAQRHSTEPPRASSTRSARSAGRTATSKNSIANADSRTSSTGRTATPG